MIGCLPLCQHDVLKKMQVSENEIFQISRKACLASHLFEDYAEDIARAITLMHKHSLNGCKELEIMLSSKDDKNSSLLKTDNSKLMVKKLNPINNLIPIIDWLLSEENRKVVILEKIDFPLIINALLARATITHGGHFCIKLGQKETILRISKKPNCSIQLDNFNSKIEIFWSKDSWLDSSKEFTKKKLEVAPETWEKLMKRAMKTYVPATEQSRLSGAGAGLLDND